MINGNLEQFLDTGWYTEAALFFNGYLYWCEAQCDMQTNISTFFIDKWAAENEDDTYYHTIFEADGVLKWSRVYEVESQDLDIIKKQFLETPIFDGKTFWQVEKQIAWLEEGTPIVKNQQRGCDYHG